MTRYLIADVELDPNTDAGQERLGQAHRQSERVICACSGARPQMYIAKIGGAYILKRMPDTGFEHAPDCVSFMPPDALTGRAGLQGSAIEEHPEDGTTLLRLGFSLSKGAGRAAPPPSDGQPATEVKTTPKKLTLTSLLHYLWEEAGLCKWAPGLEGKRSWGVVQRRLNETASSKIAKSAPLADRLFVPEPYRHDDKSEIAARRAATFRRMSGKPNSYGLLVAEYKSHEPTRLGARFTFKHLPDQAFFADADFVSRFEAVSSAHLALADMVKDSHVMIIATFRFTDQGYPILHEMGLMTVTTRWLPFDHINEATLIDAMCDANRSFVKSLRYNIGHDAPLAAMMTTDLDKPVLMFIENGSAKSATSNEAVTSAQGHGLISWVWPEDAAMPALPDAHYIRSAIS